MTDTAPNRYRLEERLGVGATGVVYRAFDTQLERTVAIKMLAAGELGEGGMTVTLREARAASGLNHPNIGTVFEVIELEGRPCIVMEYLEGTSLAAAIPPDGFPSEIVARYGIEIADALAHAHERRVIHRDLKSANIFLTAELRTKVLDFGLACRTLELQCATATAVDANPGTAAGTLAYMSPNAVNGRPPHPSDDLWSLGVVLYEMACGKLPFTGPTRSQLVSSILRDAPAELPPHVAPGLRTVIAGCLAKERGGYRRAEEVRAALQALLAETRVGSSGRARQRYARIATAVVVVGAAMAVTLRVPGWLGVGAGAGTPVTAAAPVSVAVLPFGNPDGHSELEYLTDGITETVINRLARVPGKLTVMSSGAVQAFRSRRTDAKTIGRALNVQAVLYGSVVERNGVVSVAVELVSTADHRRLWGETYHKARRDLIGVEQEIAARISAALQLELSGDERLALQASSPANTDAYLLYLKGRYHWYRSTPQDYLRSLDYFRQAIQSDASYAIAYAGLARVLSTMTTEGLLPPATYKDVEAAATRALSLDPTLGAPHESLAELKFAYEWNWDAAEIEFQQALALSPRDAAVHRYYGLFLRTQRRWEDAIGAMHRAVTLDPLSADTSKALGATYYWAGRLDQALEQYKHTLKLDPTHAQTHDLLADVYAAKGLYPQALESRRTYLRYEGLLDEAEALVSDGTAAGYRAAMRKLHAKYLEALQRAGGTQYVSPMEFALIYIALGDTERALLKLDEAFGERAPWLSSIAADPAFHPLRSDPRFEALVRRVGVPYRK